MGLLRDFCGDEGAYRRARAEIARQRVADQVSLLRAIAGDGGLPRDGPAAADPSRALAEAVAGLMAAHPDVFAPVLRHLLNGESHGW